MIKQLFQILLCHNSIFYICCEAGTYVVTMIQTDNPTTRYYDDRQAEVGKFQHIIV